MAYSANGNFISDNIIKDRKTWNDNNPVIYSYDIPGVTIGNEITGNEIFSYD